MKTTTTLSTIDMLTLTAIINAGWHDYTKRGDALLAVAKLIGIEIWQEVG